MGEVYSHLSEEERRVIRIEIGNGTIICGIVLMLGRNASTVFRQVGVSCLVMYFFRVGAGAVLLDSSLIPSPPIMPQDRARVDDP